MHPFPQPPAPASDRLAAIAGARRAMLQEGSLALPVPIEPWIEQSWRRCLAAGHRPEQALAFDLVTAPAGRHAVDSSRALVSAARPVMQTLGRALAQTRYFAILTNAQGTVIHVDGPIDRADRRAALITRIGVDLSEAAVGTTAIGAALIERQTVWLHRGEHFFADTSVYSCAGAPLFGPAGDCVGMLDLTGIDAPERPELRHLVTQAARAIENAQLLQLPHDLLVRLNWPGHPPGDDSDGLVGLNAEGWIIGTNTPARQMMPALGLPLPARIHASEVFAMPFQLLFDAAGSAGDPIELPLWSGLRLQARSLARGAASLKTVVPSRARLKDMEIAIIRKAVSDAKGNIQLAARNLGISRATIYRKLARH